MKKMLSLLACVLLVCALAATAGAEGVDAYTSASTTKTMLKDDAYVTAARLLMARSSDLADRATTEAEGYEAPDAVLANIMSVNPDGSIGVSTISQWQFLPGADAYDQVLVQLTYGQSAANLREIGTRATLLVKVEDTSYLLHLDVIEVHEQVYSKEAFEAGAFNSHYSGAERQLSSFDIRFRVLSMEASTALVF